MTTIVERLVVEDDRVIMRGRLGREVVRDMLYGHEPYVAEFREQFEILKDGGDHSYHLAAEDYYQGLTLMTVIRRKSDGRLFGYGWWDDIGNDGNSTICDSNGGEHGFLSRWDDDAVALAFEGEEPALPGYEDYPDDDPFQVWVWEPVEPFTITGYRFPEKPDGES